MPTKTYYLDEAKTDAIQVRWGLFWKNFTVSQSGQVLAHLAGRAALKQGVTMTLADGRTLKAQLLQKMGQEEVELLLDGQPLPGSATHPHYRLQQALYALLVIGGLNVLLGLVAELGPVATLLQFGFSYGTVAVGLLYGALAWWARAQKAALPLYLAMTLMVLDVVLMFVNVGESGRPGTAGLFLRFFLVMLLYKGAVAARQLKTAEAAAVPAF